MNRRKTAVLRMISQSISPPSRSPSPGMPRRHPSRSNQASQLHMVSPVSPIRLMETMSAHQKKALSPSPIPFPSKKTTRASLSKPKCGIRMEMKQKHPKVSPYTTKYEDRKRHLAKCLFLFPSSVSLSNLMSQITFHHFERKF